MPGVIPGQVGGLRAQPEGSAQVDNPGAGLQQTGSQLHGDFRRRCQKYYGNAFALNGFGGAGRVPVEPRPVADGILAMLEQNRRDMRVAVQEVNEFGPTISAISDNASEVVHLDNYTVL